MNIMANRLIQANYEIKSILEGNSHFKKFAISRVIKKLKKSLYELPYKSSFFAYDMVNFCQLVQTGKILDLCKNGCTTEHDSILVLISQGNKTHGAIGQIEVQTQDLDIVFTASMTSNIDKIGSMHIKWVKHIDKTSDPIIHGVQDIFYEYQIENDLSSNSYMEAFYQKSSKDIVELLNIAYWILPNVFCIYIENIIDNLKMRYLK